VTGAAPSTLEILERGELFALLAEEVQRLDEGQRAVVVLRYFDALPLRGCSLPNYQWG
jgi:DNA-directed RNA polymerase specialized sigma24 family protein